jgi:hypothetical protein
MPLRGVIKVGHVSSMVGDHAPTRLHWRTSPHHWVIRGEAEGEEQEEDEARQISVVTGLVQALVIHRTVRISIGPWD